MPAAVQTSPSAASLALSQLAESLPADLCDAVCQRPRSQAVAMNRFKTSPDCRSPGCTCRPWRRMPDGFRSSRPSPLHHPRSDGPAAIPAGSASLPIATRRSGGGTGSREPTEFWIMDAGGWPGQSTDVSGHHLQGPGVRALPMQCHVRVGHGIVELPLRVVRGQAYWVCHFEAGSSEILVVDRPDLTRHLGALVSSFRCDRHPASSVRGGALLDLGASPERDAFLPIRPRMPLLTSLLSSGPGRLGWSA